MGSRDYDTVSPSTRKTFPMTHFRKSPVRFEATLERPASGCGRQARTYKHGQSIREPNEQADIEQTPKHTQGKVAGVYHRHFLRPGENVALDVKQIQRVGEREARADPEQATI